MKAININQLLKKGPKIISISIGIIYFVFEALAFFMIKLQGIILSNIESTPDEQFKALFNTLYEIWRIYMPFMSLLGLGYLIFGLLYDKISINKYLINLVLTFLSLLWVVAYAISSLKYLDIFVANMANGFEGFKIIAYLFAGFGFILMFAMFTLPQYTIGKGIKRQQPPPIPNIN